LLTSLHHIYGALIYQTPERYHILFLSIPGIVFNIYIRLKENSSAKTLKLIHAVVTFLVPITLIGLFEGLYNHGLKNALYFLGTPTQTMLRLFPPPVYVMPNDFIFEFTGVLQAVLALPLLYTFVRFFARRKTL
jgi:hypothetical protein